MAKNCNNQVIRSKEIIIIILQSRGFETAEKALDGKGFTLKKKTQFFNYIFEERWPKTICRCHKCDKIVDCLTEVKGKICKKLSLAFCFLITWTAQYFTTLNFKPLTCPFCNYEQ